MTVRFQMTSPNSLDGKLQMTDSIVRLMAERIDQNYRPKVNNQNNRNNNRNNKRKY